MSRITIKTKNNNFVDIVDDEKEVVSSYYVYKKDLPRILNYLEYFQIKKITKEIVKKLIEKQWMHIKRS